MNLQGIYHIQKSNYAYAYNSKELHIRLRTAKDDCSRVNLVVSQKHRWLDKKRYQMEKIATDRLFDYYQYCYNTEDSRLGYYFEIEDGEEKIIYSESGFTQDYDDENAYFHYFQFPYINDVDVHQVPGWVHETVFYQIFVERFCNGDKKNDPLDLQPWNEAPRPHSFYGGDLQGVLDSLDYLEELGVNGIYLTPIFQSPSNHKYDTVDYQKIDPIFGDEKLLCKLVESAHQKGIRLMLDGVFNHSSWYFSPFQDVLEKGENSLYKDCFKIKGFPLAKFTEDEVNDYSQPLDLSALNYCVFGTSPNMPKLNTENQGMRQYLLDTVSYWTKVTGIDGWRLDVSDEVSHDFWRDFRKTVKEINPEALIIGENWHNAYPWLQGDQFDGVMNYPVTKSAIQFFALEEIDAEQLAADLSEYLMWNSKQVQDAMLNLLDSHDTMRFLTWCKDDERLLRMAVLLLFSYVGMPCIYYGSEIGMTGKGDPDCRKAFDWKRSHWNQELFHFYQEVTKLRRKEKALQYGSIHMEAKEGVFYLTRSHEKEKLVTVLNNTKEFKHIDILKEGKCIVVTEVLKDINFLAPYSGMIVKYSNFSM